MNWLEQTIKAVIFTVCLAVVYVTITDVMVKIKANSVIEQSHR